MDEPKSAILIVEDDLDIADMLSAYFSVQGYTVQAVNWGEDAVPACQARLPDLVILDIRLPDIDGFEVARRLRSARKTRDIPIIFLTEKRERSDRLKGLELRADHYITKPFDMQELRLHVRNVLLRAKQSSLTNPVTGLPEGSLVDEALSASLTAPDATLMVVSLKNITRFREVYGFVASDDLLRAVSLMVCDTVRGQSAAARGQSAAVRSQSAGGRSQSTTGQDAPEDFIGHLSPTDFLIITRTANTTSLSERIARRIEQSFTYFYSDQDRESGTFQDKPLRLQVGELSLRSLAQRDLFSLHAELEQFCH